MDIQEFELLLEHMEDEKLDFKTKMYELSYDPDKAKFIKDIVSMANTPREDTSYIIIGVKKNVNGSYELKGLDKYIDEATLQSQFTERVYPIPIFSFTTISYKNTDFGIISIPPVRNGPCRPTKTYPPLREGKSQPILQQHLVYFRRGSKNDIATPVDIARIVKWIARGESLTSLNNERPRNEAWETFLQAVHEFDPSRRYVLLTAPLGSQVEEAQHITALGELPWTMVFDFDPKSETNGLLKIIKDFIEKQRILHYVTLRQRPIIDAERATYWFFARGVEGLLDTMSTSSWLEWKKRYGSELQEQIKRLTAATTLLPITFIALWYDVSLVSYLNSILNDIVSIVSDRAELIVVTDSPDHLEVLTDEVEAKLVDIPFHHLCSGLHSFTVSKESPSENRCELPSSSKAPIMLDAKFRQHLSEELELVDLSVGQIPPFQEYRRRDFLRGAEDEISWYGLYNHYDIERELTGKLEEDLDELLERRRTVRHNFYHDAGAGGTTLGRRILWDYHRKYPCAILHRYAHGTTAERLHTLASLTGQPILLFIDGSQIAERQVDDLYTQLRSRNIPVVLFQVLRRFRGPYDDEGYSKRHYLSTKLTQWDAGLFIDALSQEVPEKRLELERLRQTKSARECSAFYFGLATFGRDFRGIERYVSTRLESLTSVQRCIVGFLAIAHRYAQRPIRAQAFVDILRLPKNSIVRLAGHLPLSACELLVEGQPGVWRTTHDFFDEEILQQILWPDAGPDRTRNWIQKLSIWAKDFATFCRGEGNIPDEEMLEIAKRTFIYRDNTDVLGTERSGIKKFAHLIDEIKEPSGQLDVLDTLVKLFPTEAHFWSHLGRFHSLVMGDFKKAIECLDHAIELQQSDHVLHHMKGMVLRKQAYQLMDERMPFEEIADQVVNMMERAHESFEEARNLEPDDPHNYISEAEMLISVLDKLHRTRAEQTIYDYFKLPSAKVYLKECIGRAEQLLEQVRRMREGQENSLFEERCRAKLDRLYGDYSSALQVWENLLSRPGTYRPPLRRQIVWTHLARMHRKWSDIDSSVAAKMVKLLKDNLDEEGNNDQDMVLWVQAIRRIKQPLSVDAIIEQISYWWANSETLDSLYYLYAFSMLKVLDGSILARKKVQEYIEECSGIAGSRENRTTSLEWLGKGTGINQLVHHSELGDWDKVKNFWSETTRLSRVEGRITKYIGPQAGEIEVEGTGLKAFFVPAKGISDRGASQLRDITIGEGAVVEQTTVLSTGFDKDDVGKRVDFYLGFSYDGLRAWVVNAISK